jgi:hypothetical protein
MCHVKDVIFNCIRGYGFAAVCFNLVAGKSARFIMCWLAVMPATADATVNVDRVQWYKSVACLFSLTGK